MAKLSFLTSKEKRAVLEFKKRLIQALPGEILELKLFGSKARGDSKRHSDIDLMVVLKSDRRSLRKKVYEIDTQILLGYDIFLSPKVYSKKQYDYLMGLPATFLQSVNQNAISL